MEKIYKYFDSIGLTNKKNLVMLGILYFIVILCLIGIKEIPKILFWTSILFPILFIIALIVSFFILNFFDHFHQRLSLIQFILFSIIVYILWTIICTIFFTKIGIMKNFYLLIYLLIVILGIDEILTFKLLWNIQMEKYFSGDIFRVIIVMLINFIIIGIFLFTIKINIFEILEVLKLNVYFSNFLIIIYTHFFVYFSNSLAFNIKIIFKLVNKK